MRSRVVKLLLDHTPAYTKKIVEHNIKQSRMQDIKDQKQLQPIINYITSLQKHKQYLDFFEIGVVRDQRKKIQNVAKYVGLAIRDYSQNQIQNNTEDIAKKYQKSKQKRQQQLSNYSQIIQNWSKGPQQQSKQTPNSNNKQTEKKSKNQKQDK